MSSSSLDTWADFALLDPTLDKTMSSFAAPGSLGDNTFSSSSFANAWPESADSILNDSHHHVFGLSPSGPGMVGSPNFDHHHEDGLQAWPSAFDYAHSRSFSSSAPRSDPAASTPSIDTPSDASAFQSGKRNPHWSSNTNAVTSDSTISNYVPVAEASIDFSSTPVHSLPQTTATIADNRLAGYHNNVAANHAYHLSDLVKTSNIIGAGHSGPRSLASSLSRSVMASNASNHFTPSSAHVQRDFEKLSIQQRRRMSHMEHSNQPLAHSEAPCDQRRRQHSAPGPSTNSLFNVTKSHSTHPYRKSHESSDSEAKSLGSVPLTEGRHEDWPDTLLANSHDLVFVLSLKGTVLFISPSVKRILGFLPEEIVGRPLVDFSHPADVGPFSRELKEAITLPNGDDIEADAQQATSVKGNRRVDLIMRMACKHGGFCLIETTGKVSVDPPKQRKVVVCSGRPHPIPMLPWNDVREDLLTSELSAWLKISHNGIFLGSTGPINRILGIEQISLLGRHIRDLPMVTNSTDLLEALRCGRSISVQDHYDGGTHKAPVKLTVYPWTSKGRSNALAFVHVQQQTTDSMPTTAPSSLQPISPMKRKETSDMIMSDRSSQIGSGSLSGSSLHSNGSSIPAMSANDAAATVFSELTGFHSGSWLIEMQKLHNTNRRLRHELSALRKRSSSNMSKPIC